MPHYRRDEKLTILPAFLEGTSILCTGTQYLFHEKPHNADFSVKACKLLVSSPREEWALLWSSRLPASSPAPTTPQLLPPRKVGESDSRASLVAEEAANSVNSYGSKQLEMSACFNCTTPGSMFYFGFERCVSIRAHPPLNISSLSNEKGWYPHFSLFPVLKVSLYVLGMEGGKLAMWEGMTALWVSNHWDTKGA